jgi:hypothetical protein
MERLESEDEGARTEDDRENAETEEEQTVAAGGGCVVGDGGVSRKVGNRGRLAGPDLIAVGRTGEGVSRAT